MYTPAILAEVGTKLNPVNTSLAICFFSVNKTVKLSMETLELKSKYPSSPEGTSADESNVARS